MRADILKREFEESPSLRQPLLRYTQALLIQMAQSGICHGHHQLVEQFCRLLLSSMDRLSSNDVALTQDTIANLLGVRRESITAAAGKLLVPRRLPASMVRAPLRHPETEPDGALVATAHAAQRLRTTTQANRVGRVG